VAENVRGQSESKTLCIYVPFRGACAVPARGAERSGTSYRETVGLVEVRAALAPGRVYVE
jgi:hypothetical protein